MSQPESTDKSLSNQDLKDESLPTNPLQNLFDLLNESVDRESDNSSHSKKIKPIEQQADFSLSSTIKENKPLKTIAEPKLEEPTPKGKDILSTKSDKPKKENLEPISDSTAPFNAEKKSQSLEDRTHDYLTQEWILEKEKKVDELAESINILLPLVVELSKADSNSSEEHILKAIVPIIDRVIQQRSQEDQEKMASAIANILPEAIRYEMKSAPESIGRAIAPEIALSIKEQTTLSEGAIANALGSEMGKAIKKQIETERDAMVDALYPVIGSTISKYMAEVVESINAKVDAAFSPQGIQRKIKARMRGISEAELILKESLPYEVKAVFLIHKDSGLLIKELQIDTAEPLEADLLAGMLTAIRSFANDCFASDSELGEIDYDNFQIILETAGYCYLAVVVVGEPDKEFRYLMRKVFSEVVIKYSDAIENYQGNPDTVPESMQPFLEQLIIKEVVEKKEKGFAALWWLITFLLGLIFIPWGIVAYKGWTANRIEKAVAIELDANPELSVYRLIPQVKKGQLYLKGRVPTIYLRNLAATTSKPIAREENIELNNKIIAVDVPTDPTVTAREVARLTKAVNQNSENIIETVYQNKTVTINAFVLNSTAQKNLSNTFASIPGVEKVIFVVNRQLQIETKIYFPSGSSKLSLSDDAAKIERVISFLNKYPSVKLKIIGHSDGKGSLEINLKLARERANTVYQALLNKGIDPQRLEVIASLNLPPGSKNEQPLWLSRCVRFESFI